jgi:hypothetical protein
MPEPSNPTPPTSATTFAPRNRLRLTKALRAIKVLAAVFVIAFFCAYAKTTIRYGTPHTQPQASLTQFFTPTAPHAPSRLAPHRRVLHTVRHVRRRPQHPGIYHLATLRRIRRFFSQMLDVRS